MAAIREAVVERKVEGLMEKARIVADATITKAEVEAKVVERDRRRYPQYHKSPKRKRSAKKKKRRPGKMRSC